MTAAIYHYLRQRRVVAIGAATLILGASILALIYLSTARSSTREARQRDPGLSVSLPPPDLLRPITPEEAVKANSDRPFTARPDNPAAPLLLKTDLASSDRALECLAQAVYYEASAEGPDGQRAVAQIVLNRLRHRAYPASVCGVVYQGSERATGCQFSFTCDGSLARIPTAWAWRQAQEIAKVALRGGVYGPVGHATHYHADYVLPYWADSLDKVAKIGRHIFYRLKGSLGSSKSFSQAYRGSEPLLPTTAPVLLTTEVSGESPSVPVPAADAEGLQVFAGDLIAGTKPEAPLADATAGRLLIDEGVVDPPTVSSARTKDKPACRPSDGNNLLKPLGTADMRASEKRPC